MKEEKKRRFGAILLMLRYSLISASFCSTLAGIVTVVTLRNAHPDTDSSPINFSENSDSSGHTQFTEAEINGIYSLFVLASHWTQMWISFVSTESMFAQCGYL